MKVETCRRGHRPAGHAGTGARAKRSGYNGLVFILEETSRTWNAILSTCFAGEEGMSKKWVFNKN